MRRPIILAALAACVALPAMAQTAEEGESRYKSWCVACHGLEARGDGPMAEMLTIETPDLTLLAETNGGVFPTKRVARRIDGRDPVLGHGGEMPVYGDLFDGKPTVIETEGGELILMSRPVAELIVWLRSVQE
ncbi:c-type cytochrome [Rhodovulum sp. YNF3179]|uniref:c-type cytochrome n=1 Tax=Rhodovulum sp. YNF3179 TaxID=3425127 RepID=UPI003D34DA17